MGSEGGAGAEFRSFGVVIGSKMKSRVALFGRSDSLKDLGYGHIGGVVRRWDSR